eukprot:CAMPEP_0171295658 /NCGR_PEP_ID=MMETSP0816-20121228/4276_1 /TAXON_ID=420281 /ORGANISM="Proboscia inermis, Strain CCAP1064/1" /LENGTH=290 /DNA_ID=CAMNT_0011768501 /DNA_START=386 /DNA_END=1258 /DNA_ORIENTATION=-
MQDDHRRRQQRNGRCHPFVTLSYAQTVDGMIALQKTSSSKNKSSNLAISGKESMVLTHALRSVHDGIVIGVNTFLIDNPRLNMRIKMPACEQPRPIVLDTQLRSLLSDTNDADKDDANGPKSSLEDRFRAQNAIICCSHSAFKRYNNKSLSSLDMKQPTVVPCDTIKSTNGDEYLDLRSVLQTLYESHNIKSMMVEGGSAILSSFVNYNLPAEEKDGDFVSLVNCMCVTISPAIIGGVFGLSALEAVGRTREEPNTEAQENDTVKLVKRMVKAKFITVGSDCILLCEGWY